MRIFTSLFFLYSDFRLFILILLFGMPCKPIHLPTYLNPHIDFFKTNKIHCNSVECSYGLAGYSNRDIL